MRSRHIPFPKAAELIARAHHRVRVDLVSGGKGHQQRFVRRDVVEDTGEKMRLARGVAERAGPKPVIARKWPSRSGSSAMKPSAAMASCSAAARRSLPLSDSRRLAIRNLRGCALGGPAGRRASKLLPERPIKAEFGSSAGAESSLSTRGQHVG
jgi:hypothetical protein